VVRKFGKYSGLKEIESIAVDDEMGYIYYSDEQFGVHKYYADPAKGNEELSVFGQGDFTSDVEEFRSILLLKKYRLYFSLQPAE
jgi:3-phytase